MYQEFRQDLETGDIEELVALFAEDAVYRDRTFDLEVRGREAIRAVMTATISGFARRSMEVRRVAGSDSVAVTEWVLRGTFEGSILGIAPDNASIELEGVSIGVVRGGRIAEHTDYLDRTALEQRLGLRRPRP